MSGFRVDVLLKALEELQTEKGQNEQLLAEECFKCKKLESKAEGVMSTLTLMSEKNAKTKETLRMEEQRVEQTQKQIQQFEQVNNGIRQRIAQLNQQIDQTKEEKQSNLSVFEERMGELQDSFRSGWHNTKESTMADYEEQKLKLTDKKEAYQKKLRSLMEEIEIEEEALQDTANEIPTSTLDEVCKMFEVENITSKAALERKQQELCLQDLERELVFLLEKKGLTGKEIEMCMREL